MAFLISDGAGNRNRTRNPLITKLIYAGQIAFFIYKYVHEQTQKHYLKTPRFIPSVGKLWEKKRNRARTHRALQAI